MAITPKNTENYSVSDLLVHINTLESELKEANTKLSVTQDLLKDLTTKNNQLAQQMCSAEKEYLKRIAKLNDPDSRFGDHLSWIGKVIFILRREKKPLRAVEIYNLLDEMDTTLYSKANPNSFISVVLAKAVREKRLSLHKVYGTRGGYYAIEDWVDENGVLFEGIKMGLL